MLNNVVMTLVMVGHESPREVAQYDSTSSKPKKIAGTEVTKVRTLFVRSCSKLNKFDKLNSDGTYPYCHACVVDLTLSMFSLFKPNASYEFACDVMEHDFKTSIIPKRVCIDDKIIDLKSEDVVSITDSDDDID